MTRKWFERLTDTDEGRRLLEQERLVLEATEAIATLMEQERISRTELARKINKSPAYITKLLRGTNNFTLRNLSDVFFALGRSAHITLGKTGDGIQVPKTETPRPLQLSQSWPHQPAKRSRSWTVNVPKRGDGQDLAA